VFTDVKCIDVAVEAEQKALVDDVAQMRSSWLNQKVTLRPVLV